MKQGKAYCSHSRTWCDASLYIIGGFSILPMHACLLTLSIQPILHMCHHQSSGTGTAIPNFTVPGATAHASIHLAFLSELRCGMLSCLPSFSLSLRASLLCLYGRERRAMPFAVREHHVSPAFALREWSAPSALSSSDSDCSVVSKRLR